MTIPSNIRVPLVYVAFDPSKAFQGAAILRYKALIMGQKTTAGTKAELEVFRVRSADEVMEAAGVGSQAHRMAIKWFENNKFTETYCVLIDEAATGVAANSTIVIAGTATEDGTLYFMINGVAVPVAITSGDAASDIGDAFEAAVTAETKLPVGASNAAGTVTMTAKDEGENGNAVDMRINYNDGETSPAGLTITINPLSSGANNPDVDEIIAVLGDEWYNVIVHPWNDTTNLGKIETELADRFGALRMIDSVAFTCKRDTVANLSTFGNLRNSPHVCCPHNYGIPEAPEELAAAMAAQVAYEAEQDPARPFQSLELKGIHPPVVGDRFDFADNNSLLFDGISTIETDSAGKVRIQRAITMYQKNAQDADDIAYLNLTTMFTLMYIRYDFRNYMATRYPRAKLADDGARTPTGQQVMTPKLAKAEFVNRFKVWSEDLALVENIDQFKRDLVAERDENDPDRLNILASPDLINQLRVLGATIQFLLQGE